MLIENASNPFATHSISSHAKYLLDDVHLLFRPKHIIHLNSRPCKAIAERGATAAVKALLGILEHSFKGFMLQIDVVELGDNLQHSFQQHTVWSVWFSWLGRQPTSTIEVPTIEPDKKTTEQDIALRLNAVSAKFVNKFSIDAALLAEPMRYDMTNDGKEEIVLFTKKQYNDGLENYYIGVYSMEDGSELFAEQYEANDELLVAPISNSTYNHALAIINIYAGGSGTFLLGRSIGTL